MQNIVDQLFACNVAEIAPNGKKIYVILNMEDYSDYSAPELVKMLGHRFKDYRLRANMTQKEVAEMAGLSVLTVYRFENGTVMNMSLSSFLLLLKAVGSINDLSELMPEQPESLYLYKDQNKKVQRIRHKK